MSSAAMTAHAYSQSLGNPDAAVIAQHRELVKRIAWHLAARLPASVDVDDLIQAGTIGLIEAARHYSGDRGAKFETYAGIRIRGAMIDELRRGDWAPRSVHKRMRDVSAVIHKLEQESGHEASEAEIVSHMGIDASEYREIIRDAVQCQVLSMEAQSDEDDPLQAAADDAGPADALEREAFQESLASAIQQLPERERLLMSLYYDDELNLREIGEVMGVTESRVCQLHGQALLRLRGRLSGWRDQAARPAPAPRKSAARGTALNT